MFDRPYWRGRIEALLRRRNVLWLHGVRRAGKTVLCRSLPDVRFHDCELPRVRRELEDPEFFFRTLGAGTVVLDEIHRLQDPSETLKIAADHFPKLRVIATGSSTLSARRKFRDTLAGRKQELWLLPAVLADLRSFGSPSLEDRMLRGGLPPMLLGPGVDDEAYRDWIDSYWAKDLQELFTVDRKPAFIKLMELLIHQSGGLFEASAFTGPCSISRQTVQNYLQILETTLVVTVVRPFAGGRASEIKSQPKVYAFDTGFVCYARGWDSIRRDDRGMLLEHLVLNELLAQVPRERVHFWRDTRHHEVDFVVRSGRGSALLAIECKADSRGFDPAGLRSFRSRHPKGINLVVALDLSAPMEIRVGDLPVRLIPFSSMDSEIATLIGPTPRV